MPNIEQILDGLNEEQYRAATSIDGAYRLIAGAGSGKTFTLKKRVAYICETKQIAPSRVLSVTFTNKAAAEMRERVAKELNISEDALIMKTFHSLSVDIVKRDCKTIFGWTKFQIGETKASSLVPQFFNKHPELLQGLTPEEETKLKKYMLSKVFRALNSDYYIEWLDKKYGKIPLASTKDVLEYCDLEDKANKAYTNCKNNIKKTDDTTKIKGYIEKYREAQLPVHPDKITPPGTWVREIIQDGKKGICSFDDLIKCAVYMLENYADIKEYWSNQFDFIQVDEFQDTDSNQLRLIQALYERHGNLFVVGDPDQSIYLFRGAEPTLFNDLDNYIPNLTTIFMNTNYRSSTEIVNMSNKVIELNRNRIPKECHSNAGNLSKVITLFGLENNKIEQQEFTIIQDLLNKGVNPNDIAILYRSVKDKSVIELQNMLMTKGIPVVTTLKPALNICYGFTLALCKYSLSKDGYFLNEAATYLDDTSGTNAPTRYLDFNEIAKIPLNCIDIYTYINSVVAAYTLKGEPTAAYTRFLEKEKDNKTNITKAIDYWGKLSDIQKQELLITDELNDESSETTGDGIKIFTMHKSKGLEWDYTFVNGLTTDVLDSKTDNAAACDEQARLLYVAYSRAKKQLYLACDDIEKMHGTLAQVIDIPENGLSDSVKKELKEQIELVKSNYFDRLDSKSIITYVPLQYKDTIIGYRCDVVIKGEHIAYQAKLEDLKRLNCEPKAQEFLVRITKPMKVVKLCNSDMICFDELNHAIDRVTLVEDADILAVFSGGCKDFVKDKKDIEKLVHLRETKEKEIKTTIVTPPVNKNNPCVKDITPSEQSIKIQKDTTKVCTYNDFVFINNKKQGIKCRVLNIEQGCCDIFNLGTNKKHKEKIINIIQYVVYGKIHITNPSILKQLNIWL